MTVWQAPAGTTGDPRLVRTSLPLLQEDPRSCPRGAALHARPFVQQFPPRSRRRPVKDFAPAPMTTALDAIEFDGIGVDTALHKLRQRRDCHPSHLAWATEAVRHYLAARAEHAAEYASGPQLLPAKDAWVTTTDLAAPDARGAVRYERTAWGRRYASPDGHVREIWLLSVNSVKPRTDAEIAEAAAVAATGVPARAEFGEPYRPTGARSALPERVRVVAVGCGDGSRTVLADWDAEEAAERFARHAKSVLARAVAADQVVPGSTCVDCEGLPSCSQPPRVPLLLGTDRPRRQRRRRSVSVSDLRTHAVCPAKYHLTRVLHLKSAEPESPAIRRGRAVDAWLNEQHGSRRSCRSAPLPDALPGLTAEETKSAVRMIAEHAAVCPLDGLPPDAAVQVQPRVTAYDPEVDAVIIADPDLLYTDAGGWVWRETKTAASRPWEGRPLLESFPQLALAVLLMSAGVLGGDPRRARIELELLYQDGSACEELYPDDPETLDEARRVVAGLAGPWASDESFAATPGRGCTGCEALRWCGPGLDHTTGS
ncbi:PD-(D/E)XK nuclease family protein [Kitasatospora sp. NPDC059817]|uniref:PD-(D/E)XK nuclease family protein n=1 Tax=Kitasatospora sp. NPDC059817 TaxID=3346961 RepID=UPI00366476E8